MNVDRDPAVSSAIRISIAVLCGGAGVLIILIAAGSRLGDTGGRATMTALVFAFFSLTGMAGTTLARNQPALAWFGYLTAIVSATAILWVTISIWAEHHPSNWRLAGNTVVLAIAGAQASLLLGSRRYDDSENVRLLRLGTLAMSALLTLLARSRDLLYRPGSERKGDWRRRGPLRPWDGAPTTRQTLVAKDSSLEGTRGG